MHEWKVCWRPDFAFFVWFLQRKSLNCNIISWYAIALKMEHFLDNWCWTGAERLWSNNAYWAKALDIKHKIRFLRELVTVNWWVSWNRVRKYDWKKCLEHMIKMCSRRKEIHIEAKNLISAVLSQPPHSFRTFNFDANFNAASSQQVWSDLQVWQVSLQVLTWRI